MRRELLVLLVVFSLGLAATQCVEAQTTTTTMFGTVTDKSGATVAGAQVTTMNTDTNLSRTVQTNAEGQYRIEFLPVGNYALEVSATGFKKFIQKGIKLEVDQNVRVDARLDVGAVTETVDVISDMPLVNTSNAEIGRTVENAEIVDLPIVNRNVYTLLALVPGVQSSQNSIVLGYPEQRTLINGGVDGGAGSVSYYLDGGTNMTGLRNTGNILPNPDAIQEFRVETNNYNAEYGRFSGGVVTVITKSGTNNFHGSLFEFVRNTIFNANIWGNVITPTNPKPPLHRNQFGGTLGGPIRKDKTFFFFSYQGLRQTTPTFLNGATVPTTLERTGNFSASSPAPVNPTTGKPFPGGMIGPLDPVATKIISTLIPTANLGTNGWRGSIPSPFNTDDFLAKVDHNLTNKQRLTVSYFETSGNNNIVSGGLQANGVTPNSNIPWALQQFNWRQQNVNLSDTWTISSTKVNQTWLTYTRNFGGRLNLPQTSLGDLGSAFTIQGTPSLPQITVTGFFTAGQSIAGPLAGTNFYSVRDVLSYTHGRHALNFGTELSLNKDIQATLLNNYGIFTFSSGRTTGTPPLASTGNALADFELGLPSAVAQDAPVTPGNNSWYTASFVQDNFRAFPRLTFNLGLRWDIQTPPTDPANRESTFVQGVQSRVNPSAPLGVLFPGDPGITRGIVPVRWHHVSPRVGIAWDPFGDGKTSLRAGAGVFWGSTSGNNWNMTSNFEPFAIRLNPFPNVGIVTTSAGRAQGATLSNPYHNFPGGNPFPYTGKFVTGGSILGVSPNFQWPYSYQFNLSVERQILRDFSVSVAYVGTLSHNLPFAVDVNYPTPCPIPTSACSGSGSSVLSRRPIDTGTLGQIFVVGSNQHAAYHGLQITTAKRMSHHLLFNAYYTYSKTLDSVELQNNTTNPTAAGQVPQNYRNLAPEKARADFDLRHQFVASAIWQVDYYSGQSAVLRGILNGWTISPIVMLRSGLPFTVVSGRDNNLDGTSANDRPNLVPTMNAVLDSHRSRAQLVAQWFNTAAFTQNCVGNTSTPTCLPTDGNAARNLLDGPGFRDVDLAIFRNFKIKERFDLQARVEASNVFNTVSLNSPNATLTSSAFGKITSAQPMRQLQLGLRLTF